MARNSITVLGALILAAMLLPGIAEARRGHGGHGPGRRSVPEFDPATAGIVAALVAGGGVLLARQRRR